MKKSVRPTQYLEGRPLPVAPQNDTKLLPRINSPPTDVQYAWQLHHEKLQDDQCTQTLKTLEKGEEQVIASLLSNWKSGRKTLSAHRMARFKGGLEWDIGRKRMEDKGKLSIGAGFFTNIRKLYVALLKGTKTNWMACLKDYDPF